MADDYINDMFNLTGLESEGVTLDQFSEKASSGDEAFLNDMFNLTGLESEGVNLVIRILKLAGITLKDPGLVQLSTQEEVKGIQQEKQ